MPLTRRPSIPAVTQCASLFLLLSIVFSACKTPADRSQPQSFGWDEDVEDPKTKPTVPPDLEPTLDRNFCKGLAAGTCLTLVLRIPKADLIQDIGLSTLALGASSKVMRSRMDEACQAAWQDYQAKFKNDSLRLLRQRLVTRVVKMRCLYQFTSAELVQEDIRLADNEIGLSARLTKFNMSAANFSGDIRIAGIDVSAVYLQAAFRSAAFFSGKSVSEAGGKWRSIDGLGVAPIEFKTAVDRGFNWRLDWAALGKSIERVASNKDAPQASVSSFFTLAKNAVAQISAAGNPAAGGLLMIGMGYNAYQALCGEDPAACKMAKTESDKTGEVGQDFADLVPNSDTNELFRLSMIRTVHGILDQIMERGSSTQMADLIGSK